MVRDVRRYLEEHGWRREGGAERWRTSAAGARDFPGGPLALAAQVQLELDRLDGECAFSDRIRARLVELGWEPTGYGFLVDAVGDRRAYALAAALDVQLRREAWHERRTGVELPTPAPAAPVRQPRR
jgi:hypothetical protein